MKKRHLLAGIFVPVMVLGVIAFLLARNSMKSVVRPELDITSNSASSLQGEARDWEPGTLGWNRFRGANGRGVIEDEQIPSVWSMDENLRWSTELTGDGSSSPVLSEHQVFLTSYECERERAGDISSITRYVSSYERESGTLLWEQPIEGVLPEDPYIGNGLPEHGYATNTPVVDQQHVYAFLGKSGVFCFTLDGEQVWQRSVGTGSNPKGWGSCASLILYDDCVIVNAAEESESILALNCQTGEVVWRAESPDLHYAFGTPALVKAPDGSQELVVGLPNEVWGLNPENGKLLWFASTPSGAISHRV
jgi:outer membrane protein assembly factor BamB